MTWISNKIESGHHPGTHRKTVAERISCRNGSKIIRIINDRREKIYRLDNRQIVTQFVDTGIIAGVLSE
jgi:hypothetical protein